MRRSRRSAKAAPRAALAATAAVALLLIAGACAQSSAEPKQHADAADAGTRLDLAGARFEQVADSELALEISTHAAWDPADVKPSATRALCVWLRNELSRTPQGRLCVVPLRASEVAGAPALHDA